MTTEFDSRFDCEDLLSFAKATLSDGVQAGFTGTSDETKTLEWVVPYPATNECRAWLRANRLVSSDFDAAMMHFDGPWRLAKTEDAAIKQRDGSITGSIIRCTLARGYYTTLDWETARLMSHEWSNTNSSDADSVENTASSDPNSILDIRFPYCDPEHSTSMAETIEEESISSPVVNGVTYSGEYRVIMVTVKEAEDGTHTIALRLALPQYTLEAYRGSGGHGEDKVVYLWGVPKDLAQGIVDDWKSTFPLGSTASCQYNEAQKLVDMVLSRAYGNGEELSAGPFQTKCDTTLTWDIAFGLSKEDAIDFVNDRNSITDQGGTQSIAGVSRNVKFDQRGDGLYDVTIITQYTPYVEAKHKEVITVNSGAGDVEEFEYGWEVPLAKLDLIKTAWSTTTAGKVRKIEIKKNEERCNFDYVAYSKTLAEKVATVNSSGDGIAYTFTHGENAATIPSVTSAKRTKFSISAKKGEDGRFEYTISSETEKETHTTASTYGGSSHGQTETIWAGKNADVGDVSTIISDNSIYDSPRSRVVLEVYPNPDGTLNYVIKKTDVYAVDGTAAIAPALDGNEDEVFFGGQRIGVFTGQNKTASELAAVISGAQAVAGAGKNWKIDIRPSEDGRFSYELSYIEQLQAETNSNKELGIDLGSEYAKITEYVGVGVSPEEAAASITTGTGYTNEGTIDVDRDGKIVYKVRNIHKLPKETHVKAHSEVSGIKIAVTITRAENQATEPADDTTFTDGVETKYEDVSVNDDGTYNYIKIVTERSIDTAGGYDDWFTTKYVKLTEKVWETVFSSYFTSLGKYMGIWLKRQRNVKMHVWMKFKMGKFTEEEMENPDDDESYTFPDDFPAETTVEQKEIGAGIWALTRTETIYGEWDETPPVLDWSGVLPEEPA